MKLKTSFFNKTLLVKDIRRFMPVWGIYSAILLLSITNMDSFLYFRSKEQLASSFISTIGFMAVANFVYALIVSSCLFGDLFRSRLSFSIHALPLRRDQIYFTHCISGLLFSLILNTLMAAFHCLRLGSLFYLAPLWLLASTLQYLFFFSLAVVCCILTGSRFAHTAVYLVINFISVIIQWFLNSFYIPLLKGVTLRSDIFAWICPPWKLIQMEWLDWVELDCFSFGTGWGYLAILGGLAVGFTALGLWLYQKRHLETAGNFLSFHWLIPVFSLIFSLGIAAIFSLFGGTVVGFLVGLVGTEMLMRRTISVFDKKFFRKAGIFVGVFVLSIILTLIDPLGISRWVPQPQQVACVEISDLYSLEFDSSKYDPYTLQDSEDIHEIIQIHQLLLKEDEPTSYGRYIRIVYTLNNGRKVERRYQYDHPSDIQERIDQYFCSPEYILGYHDWEEYLSSVFHVRVDGYEYRGQKAQELLEAIRDDAREGWFTWESELQYTAVIYTDSGNNYVNIPYRCPRTQQWLAKNQ